ncbi:hypothetical protein AHAS_Ahas12G0042600 [Arachis hypogaea]
MEGTKDAEVGLGSEHKRSSNKPSNMDEERVCGGGNMMGIVVETKNPRRNFVLERPFLRVEVAIDITTPIPIEFWLNRSNLSRTWINFKYERIQDTYCLNCGIIEHVKKECKRPMTMACWHPEKPRYSAGVGVNKATSLAPMGDEGGREEFSANQEREDEVHGDTRDHQENRERQHTVGSRVGGGYVALT